MSVLRMKIVFMGTMDFAVPILKALDEIYEIVLVVTQPDRPAGRKQELKISAVKAYALLRGLPVFQPEKIRKDYQPVLDARPDLVVVAAFGQMIPNIVLGYPKYRCINVHASLLPKYRGGAPMQKAIVSGDAKTGVTVMYMAEKMDAGEILSQEGIPILETDNLGTIETKLADLGSRLLIGTLPKVFDGSIVPQLQNEAEATFANNIRHDAENIDFSQTARQVFNHVRGFNPRPIAATSVDGTVMKVYEVLPVTDEAHAFQNRPNGEIVKITKSDVFVKVADGLIALKTVQLAGKKTMDIKSLMNGSGKNVLQIGKILK
jgi:methionyl-tRNA formyltransferase